ncbi:hypothetical protein ACHAXR_005780 [Thalassiosira sp. AJA248-18]
MITTIQSSFLILLFMMGINIAAGDPLFGLRDIDPKTLTDVLTAAALAQGFLAMEAPELNLWLYGTKDKSLYTQAFSKYVGAAILSYGVISLCIFTLGLEVNTAIGWSLVVWAATHAQALLNQVPSRMGLSPVGQGLWLIYCISCIHACFTNAPFPIAWYSLLMAIYALNMVTCIVAILLPRTFAKIYGGREVSKLNNDQLIWTQGYGFENLAMCVLALALLKGVDPHQALGFMSLPIIVHCAQLLFGGTDLGSIGNALVVGWAVFHGANFTSLAFPKK